MMSVSKRILYIDYIAPIGHVAINNYIIKDANKNYDNVHLISKSLYLSKINIKCKKIVFFQIPFNSFITNYLNLAISLVQIIFLQFKYDKLIFLSFENRFFPVFSYFFYKNTCVFVHNNLDLKVYKKLNLFSLIKPKTIFYVFENFISNFIKNKYGFSNFKTINHPIITDFLSQSIKKKDLVFAPGSSNEYDILSEEKIIRFLDKNNLKLITKTPFVNFKSENITNEIYFKDINSFYYSSKWVLINCNYSYRVSGIFYEAIGADCNILFCNESLFLHEMKKKYPNKVHHINSLI